MGGTIQQILAEAREGRFRPVVALIGEETLLIDRAIALLKRASVGDGIAGFNDDVFHGVGFDAGAATSVARTVPMMSDTRFVLVRGVDKIAVAQHPALIDYIKAPCDSTCFVLAGPKVNGNTKFGRALKPVRYDAKKLTRRGGLAQFLQEDAKARGHTLTRDACEALLDALGEDLSGLDDALERLSLFVGPGQRIDNGAIAAIITRSRPETVWALVDAISAQDRSGALGAAQSLLNDREPPPRLLPLLSRQLRMVGKMRQALADGKSDAEACKVAGAPPFKARELKASARRFTLPKLSACFATLAETDLLLKASTRPEDAVFLEAVMRLCDG